MANINPHDDHSSWGPQLEPLSWNSHDNIRRNNSTGRRSINIEAPQPTSIRNSPYAGPTRSGSVGSSQRPLRSISQDGYEPHDAAESPPGLRRPESASPSMRRYGSQSRPPRVYDNRAPPPPQSWSGGAGPRERRRDSHGEYYVADPPHPGVQRHYNNNNNVDNTDQPPVNRNEIFHDEAMAYMRDDDDYQHGHPGPYHRRPVSSSHGARGGIGWENMTKDEKREIMRLPWLQWMNSGVKNHFVAAVGELVGTTMFLFFAFAGTEVANTQSRAAAGSQTTTGSATGFDVGVLVYIALSFGFSLMVNAWVFFRISGGLFNPAVTLGMMLVKAVSPTRAMWLLVGQLGGSMSASALVMVLFPAGFNVRTTLSPGASLVQGIFIEALLTAELVFTIFMLAKEKHRATFMAPVGIGLALFIAELVGVQYTGGSLNPARSFGPCVVTTTFDAEHWIYWVGPTIGSLIAVVFYKFIKILEYEMANPGADGDPLNDPTQNPEKRTEMV